MLYCWHLEISTIYGFVIVSSEWRIYIVCCSDSSFYTGITKDVSRRIDEHNQDNLKAAKYTRVRRPVRLIYEESVATRSEAAKRECEIKQMSRKEKEALINKAPHKQGFFEVEVASC
ncbi:MAG: GIY-YIG nuclease family protein [Gammaproteobacteria bacterium]|nr:GIY-YIG nuclease family protein [Gammaproteobacteria bacterium]